MVVPPNSVHTCSVWLKDTDAHRLMEGSITLEIAEHANPAGVLQLVRLQTPPSRRSLADHILPPVARGYADGKLTLGFNFKTPDVPPGQVWILENHFSGQDWIAKDPNSPDYEGRLRIQDLPNVEILQTIVVDNCAA